MVLKSDQVQYTQESDTHVIYRCGCHQQNRPLQRGLICYAEARELGELGFVRLSALKRTSRYPYSDEPLEITDEWQGQRQSLTSTEERRNDM